MTQNAYDGSNPSRQKMVLTMIKGGHCDPLDDDDVVELYNRVRACEHLLNDVPQWNCENEDIYTMSVQNLNNFFGEDLSSLFFQARRQDASFSLNDDYFGWVGDKPSKDLDFGHLKSWKREDLIKVINETHEDLIQRAIDLLNNDDPKLLDLNDFAYIIMSDKNKKALDDYLLEVLNLA